MCIDMEFPLAHMGSCPSWLFPLPLKMLGDLMKLWSFWEIQWIIQTHDRTIEVFHGIFNKHDEEGTSNSSGLWNCQLIQLQSLWHQEKHQLRFEHYEKKRKDQADSKSGCVFRWQSIKRSLRSMLYIYIHIISKIYVSTLKWKQIPKHGGR